MKSLFMWSFFYIWVDFITASCIPNSTYMCNDCTQTLSYGIGLEYGCIGICPTGLNNSAGICYPPTSPYLLFDTDFTQEINLNSSAIGQFNTKASSTFLTQGNPMPTKERGFYFPSNSALTLTSNYIPAPDFTFLA